MANHGSKFVSVNLNKSYGQQRHSSHLHYPHFNGGAVHYGPGASARGQAGSGGSGGMLVLSRGRSAPPKVAPKLSVPPPLNLPSLRKEHEKFDMSGTGGLGAGTGTASGSRPNSSGMGWTKPVAAVTPLLEKNESVVDTPKADGTNSTPGASQIVGSNLPPSARYSASAVVGSASADRDIPPYVDKAVLLRGEDFPSLQAARPISSGTSQKQKDGLNQRQKQVARDKMAHNKEDSYHLCHLDDIHQVDQASGDTIENRSVGNVHKGHRMASEQMNDQIGGQENYFTDPLPLVFTNTRSDWADDERDTGHGFVVQGRDIGYSNSESYCDRDFDLPRPRILPQKPGPNQYDNRWGQRDNETGKRSSSEVLKVDPHGKEARAPSREGKEVNKWRNSLLSIDGYSSQETGNCRFDFGLRMSGYNNMMKENTYIQPYYGDIGRDGSVVHNRDSSFGRSDFVLVGHQQQKNNTMESFNNRGTERNYCHVTEQSFRYRGDTYQSINVPKSSFGKMPHVTDPILNMSRDKRFSDSDKLFSEDLFSRDYGHAGFDDRDLFSEGLVGVIKRKKDAVMSTDFHDPVRESFEAELERVQKMQELERQRVIEEQERALEQAQREEEERQRRIREEDEQRRKVEEEAREAAWRAEQERVEAIRKAEEQRIAREEEKRRIQLEEERRKLAAKQKLEELEARIAKRQAESAKGDTFVSKTTVDEKLEATVKARQISKNLDLDSWEDSERIVKNVMAPGSFDSSTHSAHVEMSSRPYPPREGSSNFADRGKANNNSWKRDGLGNGAGFPAQLSDQDTGHYSPRPDAFAGGVRATPQKGFHDGAGYMHSRAYLKPAMQEPYTDDFGYHEGHHRWNLSGNPDSYGKFREIDSEFHDSMANRYGDSGWGQGRSRIITRLPYPERLYPHSEANDLYNQGRSRYSMRQPRVLPPPSLASSQRPNPRVTRELVDPSTFLDNNNQFTHGARTESTAYYDSNQGGLLEPSEIFGLQQENNTSEGLNLNNASRCDSQSSLSVSSPPTSPQRFSHDELDESGDSRVTSSVAGKRDLLTESESVAHNGNSGTDAVLMVSDNVSAVEDEEWTVENDNTMQQQEEYDEDEDGYKEEDEVRERDDENLELTQNFGSLELEEGESPHTRENVVLGFDEGVEVGLSNDDFEKKLENQEGSFEMPEISVGIMAERGTVDGFPSDDLNFLPADDSHGANADSSSADVPQKLALQGCIVPVTTAGSSDGTGLAAQQTTSSTGTTFQTNNNMPTLSSSVSQGDLPVKLQFGLFSGPSLIPTPVPAIQIGSIQMPLHIHPPVGQSITHMHSSQPPMFQFGQLRYMSPISQEILPMAPQSMSFLHQANMLGHFNLIPNAGGSVTHDPSRENLTKNEVPFIPINNQLSFNSASPEQSGVSGPCDEKAKSTLVPPEKKGQHHAASRSYLSSSKANSSESQSHHVQSTVQSSGGDQNYSGVRRLGPLSGGGKGRRFAYAVKNTNTRSSVQDYDTSTDSNVFPRRPRRTVQRTEFRVRENNDRRLQPVSNNASLDDRSNYNRKSVGVFTRSGSKRGKISNRIMKQIIESETMVSGNVTSQEVFGDRAAKEMSKDLLFKSQSTSQPGEANMWGITSEEDVNATLQSGVVRVFKQPGIEAPSDDDDFIEVRSKRQLLNDRREQREKEIKARSGTTKPPRKPHASRAMEVVSRSHNKLSIPLGSGEAKSSQLNFTAYESPHFANNEVSTGCMTAAPQPPIWTPPVNSGAQAIKSTQAGSVSIVSNEGTLRETGLNIDSKNKVMSLSQSQIDEAMKPARYDSNIPTVGGRSSTVSAPILPMPSILTKDKSFSSGSSPISSLLAGEKIQFGAVTSPTILPTSSRIVSYGIGAPGSNRPDPQISCNFPISEKGDSLFFSKEEQLSEHVEDSEAEAEAAASAVAVAAISSDDMVGNGNDAKSFSACIKDSMTGVVGDQHLASQSQSEELLSVSLPADLSVETAPISLWQSLPSPQSSSNQMLSHFPAGPSSHFPFYEMNPLLGAPIFAFSPQEESSGVQSHPPKNTPPTSEQLGSWQQCHSGVDSFYGASAEYSGPFIGPPGGIRGVQGPTPHMVVYNHFAPIRQYGQVGLSFMGATYIPSGKQGDWKNSVPTSSSGVRSGEGDINNVNMSNVHRSGPNMTAPIQHLAPGSPLLPMPPSVPMFDVSPFQTAADLHVQARWGHIPASPLHPVPVSRPLQPQIEGTLPSQVNHVHPVDQSLTANRFTESQTPTQSDNNNSSLTISPDTNVAPLPSQLGLSDSLGSTTVSSGQSVAVQISSGSANSESGKSHAAEHSKPQKTSPLKTRYSRRNVSSTQQGYNNNTNSGYGYQRSGAMSYRSMGNEFHHRRMDYRGRNQSGGVNRGYHSSKVKQIYVPKQSTSGGSST
ncbi:hypothetical protein OROGR_006989 [Orobanche gracilis]